MANSQETTGDFGEVRRLCLGRAYHSGVVPVLCSMLVLCSISTLTAALALLLFSHSCPTALLHHLHLSIDPARRFQSATDASDRLQVAPEDEAPADDDDLT